MQLTVEQVEFLLAVIERVPIAGPGAIDLAYGTRQALIAMGAELSRKEPEKKPGA